MVILRNSPFFFFEWNVSFFHELLYFGDNVKQKKWISLRQEEMPRNCVEQIFSLRNFISYDSLLHFYLLLFVLLHRYYTENGLCHFDSCYSGGIWRWLWKGRKNRATLNSRTAHAISVGNNNNVRHESHLRYQKLIMGSFFVSLALFPCLNSCILVSFMLPFVFLFFFLWAERIRRFRYTLSSPQ